MAQLTVQQELVLQQKNAQVQAVLHAADNLDSKAAGLVQAGGLIVALSSAVSISGYIAANPSPIILIALAVAFLAFMLMLVFAIQAWLPRTVEMPGTRNWDEIFNDYINEEPDKCFEQVLADAIEAIRQIDDLNLRKAQRVYWAAWLLGAQVAGLLIASVFVSLQ